MTTRKWTRQEIGRMGGLARAASQTPEQRHKQAMKASAAREAKFPNEYTRRMAEELMRHGEPYGHLLTKRGDTGA